MEKQNKYHVLYKTTCKVTGNFYIGVHSTGNIEDSYLGSGKRLGNSINKYGKENHIREILEFFDTKEKAFEREREVVNEFLLSDKKCMNLNRGGDGGWSSSMQSENGRKSNIKKWASQENRNKQSIKLSEQSKILHQLGILKAPDWNGKKHKEETIEKLRNHKRQTGEKNSMFGKVWIHNELEKKSFPISKDETEAFIEKGWKKGRKKFK